MGWSAIILALIEIFGPLLLEWLKKWLEDRLNKAAARIGPRESFGSEAAAATALFDQAISDLPWYALGRKALLRRMKANAVEMNAQGDFVLVKKLDPEDIDELRGLAAIAENE